MNYFAVDNNLWAGHIRYCCLTQNTSVHNVVKMALFDIDDRNKQSVLFISYKGFILRVDLCAAWYRPLSRCSPGLASASDQRMCPWSRCSSGWWCGRTSGGPPTTGRYCGSPAPSGWWFLGGWVLHIPHTVNINTGVTKERKCCS